MKENAELLALVFGFLSQLSEEQLKSLLRKQTKLTIEAAKTKKTTVYAPCDDTIEKIASTLNGMNSREEALKYLQELKLTKKKLLDVAEHCKVSIYKKDTIKALINKIVEKVVGSRLKYEALLNTNLNG